MTEFNPNCGRCGMLNSWGFCSLTACRYPSNVIVAEPKVIRGMMVNPQIEKPMTHYDEIKAMSVEELAGWISHITGCPLNNFLEHSPLGKCVKKCKAKDCWIVWLKSPVEGSK